jgi:hypothetical protein
MSHPRSGDGGNIACALLAALWLCAAVVVQAAPKQTGPCRSATFTAEVRAERGFQKAIGEDLLFKLTPARLGSGGELSGWEIRVTPAKEPGKDYIYPVNPPLRFNSSQTLGASYGEGTKTSLASSHEMHFLLARSDYDRIQPLLTDALWPYAAPDPDEAANQYVTAVNTLSRGWLKITVLSYDLAPETESIRRVKVRAEIRAPRSFAFAPELGAKPSACPAAE